MAPRDSRRSSQHPSPGAPGAGASHVVHQGVVHGGGAGHDSVTRGVVTAIKGAVNTYYAPSVSQVLRWATPRFTEGA